MPGSLKGSKGSKKSKKSKGSKGSKKSKKSKTSKKKVKPDKDTTENNENNEDSTSSKKRKRSSSGSTKEKKRKKSKEGSGGSSEKKKKKSKVLEEPGPVGDKEGRKASEAGVKRSSEVSTKERPVGRSSVSVVTTTSATDDLLSRPDQNYRGMYRPWNNVKAYTALLPPVHKAFATFFPWPPRKICYFSSGYYFDLDNGGGGDLKDTELMIHNIPPGMSQADIRKQFPGSRGLTMNPDGTAVVEYGSPSEATNAYNNSNLVKLGKNHLGWVRPEELYLLNVPRSVSDDDLAGDFPDATNISFQDGPDGNRIATMKFRSAKDADKGYDDAPYKKLGHHQLGYNVPLNPLKITNLPPGMNEDELRKKFPGAKSVEINKATGTAKVVYESDDNAAKAYANSDMLKLGTPKLGWLRPEELYIEDVPKNITEDELLKEFPTGKKVKFQKGEGGKRIATVVFANEAEQKKAYGASNYTKLGPQRLGFNGSSSGGGKDAQLTISNLNSKISDDDLKKKFPGATGIKNNKDGTATIQYKTADDAKKGYDDSGLLKLGDNNLGWLRPEELYLMDVPARIKEPELMKQFKGAKKLRWQKGEGGKRIATIVFANEAAQKKAYDASNFTKIKPQILGFTDDGMGGGKGGGNTDDMTDEELAKELWQLGEVGFSNISNLFTPAINISGLPKDVNRTALLKLFPDAKKVDIYDTKKGKVAQVEFDDAKKAAHAFGVSSKLVMDGHKLTVTAVKAGKGGGGGGGGGGGSKTKTTSSKGSVKGSVKGSSKGGGKKKK